jgi:hypothetical protein
MYRPTSEASCSTPSEDDRDQAGQDPGVIGHRQRRRSKPSSSNGSDLVFEICPPGVPLPSRGASAELCRQTDLNTALVTLQEDEAKGESTEGVYFCCGFVQCIERHLQRKTINSTSDFSAALNKRTSRHLASKLGAGLKRPSCLMPASSTV